MAIEVVLLDNIEKLGKVGDTVKVANGYARNYLFPRDLAVHASQVVLKQIEARRAKVAAAHEAEVAVAQELAAKINETSITIPMQAGEDDKLFGSVTVTEIHDLLAKDGIGFLVKTGDTYIRVVEWISEAKLFAGGRFCK